MGKIVLAEVESAFALNEIWRGRKEAGRVTLFCKLFLDVVARPRLANGKRATIGE